MPVVKYGFPESCGFIGPLVRTVQITGGTNRVIGADVEMQFVTLIQVCVDSANVGAEESLWNSATVVVAAYTISMLIVQRPVEIFDDGISNAGDHIRRDAVTTDVHEAGIVAGTLHQSNCGVSIRGDIDCRYFPHLG